MDRTYLEPSSRLWPELALTAAVPDAEAATIAAMADGFERRFGTQAIDIFSPGIIPCVWTDLARRYTDRSARRA